MISFYINGEPVEVQLEGEETTQCAVEKHEIDIEVTFPHLDRILLADKREVLAELKYEIAQMRNNGIP